MSDINSVQSNSAWINGKAASCQRNFSVYNPSTGECFAECGDCDHAQFRDAIDAAEQSLKTWQLVPSETRANTIDRWADAIEGARNRLADLVVAEGGKQHSHAGHEIMAGIAALRWAAAQARRDSEQTLASSSQVRRHYTVKQPIGVVACITPWNFPVASVLVKAASAIAAGCTVVLKPSEETPLIALALACLPAVAGLLRGVSHVVPTTAPTTFGALVKDDKRVRCVSFTGSTAVGKKLYADCANTVKRVALEMGGNAPFIVLQMRISTLQSLVPWAHGSITRDKSASARTVSTSTRPSTTRFARNWLRAFRR